MVGIPDSSGGYHFGDARHIPLNTEHFSQSFYNNEDTCLALKDGLLNAGFSKEWIDKHLRDLPEYITGLMFIDRTGIHFASCPEELKAKQLQENLSFEPRYDSEVWLDSFAGASKDLVGYENDAKAGIENGNVVVMIAVKSETGSYDIIDSFNFEPTAEHFSQSFYADDNTHA